MRMKVVLLLALAAVIGALAEVENEEGAGASLMREKRSPHETASGPEHSSSSRQDEGGHRSRRPTVTHHRGSHEYGGNDGFPQGHESHRGNGWMPRRNGGHAWGGGWGGGWGGSGGGDAIKSMMKTIFGGSARGNHGGWGSFMGMGNRGPCGELCEAGTRVLDLVELYLRHMLEEKGILVDEEVEKVDEPAEEEEENEGDHEGEEQEDVPQ